MILPFIYTLGKSANCWTKWFRKVDISSLDKWANPIFLRRNSTGNVLIAGKDPREGSIFEQSKQVGTILQDQDAQFIGLTVEEDVAFI